MARGDTDNPGMKNHWCPDPDRRAGTSNRASTRDDQLEGNSKLGDKASPSSYPPDVPRSPRIRPGG